MFVYRLMKKLFLNEELVIEDAFRLGVKIFASGFRPTFIIGLWPGGSAVGIYVQECLQTLGVKTDHMPLRTVCGGIPVSPDKPGISPQIQVDDIRCFTGNLQADDRLLIIDDVFSTGDNMLAVMQSLQANLQHNLPQQIKIAALWRSNPCDKTAIQLDYWLHTTDHQLVFPYQLAGLSQQEIEQYKPGWIETAAGMADELLATTNN